MIKTFISYAREDRRFCDDLMNHLEVLINDRVIDVWNDGELVAGDEWERVIEEELHDTELFIFLWSIDSYNSKFIRNREFPFARDKVIYSRAKIVSILVRDFYQKSEFYNQLRTYQMLPKNGTPVVESRGRDRVWTSIVNEIARTCEKIRGPGPVEDLANNALATQPEESELLEPKNKRVIAVKSVSDFWKDIESISSQRKLVSVSGTFSQFAPFMIGPPIAKEELHKDFRDQIELRGRKLPPSVSACLSLTAGQMVVRVGEPSLKRKYLYFGLYNSIVRNSIPVFIDNEYFDQVSENLFEQNRRSMEALITGKISKIDNSFVFEYIDKYDLRRDFKQSTLDYLRQSPYCLIVDGKNTKIECLEKTPRYLDGDIWIGLQIGDRELFETTFLNIVDVDRRHLETTRLLARIHSKFKKKGYSVIASYESWREIDNVLRDANLFVAD